MTLLGFQVGEPSRGPVSPSGPDGLAEAGAPPPAATEAPLSSGQRALWFLDRLAPESSAYVLAGALRICGPLDVPALRHAFETLADRHPALRTCFRAEGGTGGEPSQQVLTRRSPSFVEEDAAAWEEAALETRQAELAWNPFDLERDPLLRVGVLHRGPDEHRVVVALHHIVADFWSLGVLLGELSVLYRTAGGPGDSGGNGTPQAALPPLRSTYAEHVRRQESRLAGPDGERWWEFWQRELLGRRLVLDLPTDRPRPKMQTFRGDSRSSRLDAEPTDRLRALAREEGTTLFATLLAAFQALLGRYTGEEEILVGSPTAGRSSAATAGLIGYFVNPVALRGDLAGDPRFTELLGRTRRTVKAALAHRGLPFPLLAERLAGERDPSRSPVFQVMLAFEQERGGHEQGLAALAVGAAGVPVALDGLAAETLHLPQGGAQVDLTLRAAVVAGRLALSLQFNSDLFDGTTAARMAEHLARLLTAVASDPARRLSELPLQSVPEGQALREWNATATRYAGAELCLHERIAAQAARTPDTTAVVFEDRALSYGELAARAWRFAGRLCRLGVGPEVPVGICLERSPELVVGLLAILTAGGAYVPLDPSYPPERLARMLEDARPPVVLVEERTATLLPASPGHRVVLVASPLAAAADRPVTTGGGAVPESLAYVIFTSGSTGRPKGAMNSHRGIVNRLLWARENHRLTPADRVLQKTPVSFDVSVWELFLPLLSGACLVMARPGGHRDPSYL
ncbi:MAG TPA: condensation domain-containing protein, partial [Thermoanaerobaculia bacterium]|nr:condensation domain-containing protein [Thermoanaerobaculia bacterium]